MSMVYPFIYSFPMNYGFDVSLDSGSKFIAAYAIGEVTIGSATGYLMVYLHEASVFIYPLMAAFMLRETYKFILYTLQKDSIENEE